MDILNWVLRNWRGVLMVLSTNTCLHRFWRTAVFALSRRA